MKVNCIRCHKLIFPSQEINGLCKYCRLKEIKLKNDSA
jgi:hypothetical protein